jgi:UDP-GlcNAc:undecaprenyl-phosphate GlcNAc-1-phosphate transferase
MLRHAFTFILAASLALYLTPLARQAAIKFGLFSKPDGDLRRHTEPVPYLGGVAVYLGFLFALTFVFDFDQQVLGLLLGSTIMLLVGLIDDLGVMTPGVKLFGEAVAVLALLKADIVIELTFIPSLSVFGMDPIPVFSYVLSAFWLLALANAFNFLDVEDGLAAGAAFFSALALFAVAVLNHHAAIAAVTIALAGSLLGFLRYNFRPARIYLGDSGSLFLGLLLGALAMIGQYTEKNLVAALSPVLLLGVAGFELGFTMLARTLRGIPVTWGSPDHVSKRLRRLGFSVTAVAVIHYLAAALLGGAGILIMLVDTRDALMVTSAVGVLMLVLAVLLLRVKVEWRPNAERK